MTELENIKLFVKHNVTFKNDDQRYVMNRKLKKKDMNDMVTQLCYVAFDIFNKTNINSNVIDKTRDDEINKLKRELGHLRTVNAKHKVALENYKNDMKSLSDDYFALLDRKEKIERTNEDLNIKVNNLNRQLKQTKNVSPPISPPKKSITPPVIIYENNDPDKDYKHPVENTQDYKDIKLQMIPLENIIKEKTKEKNDLYCKINDEMNKENINLKKITDILEPKIKTLENEIVHINDKLKPYRNLIKKLTLKYDKDKNDYFDDLCGLG
jgi:predicted  nucleic acid-binding Zn-ribbon protein